MYSRIILFLLLAITMGSCRKTDGTYWDAEYLAPIARADIALDQLYTGNLLNKAGDSSYSLEYSQLVYTLSLIHI